MTDQIDHPAHTTAESVRAHNALLVFCLEWRIPFDVQAGPNSSHSFDVQGGPTVGVNGRHGIDIDWQFSDFVLSERCLSERPCRKAMKAPELAHDPRFPFMERGYIVRVQKYAKGFVSTKELLLTNGKDGDDIFY